ncbi:MAG: hypothetical protein HOP29_16865, partial [Phycisphaerales bacterium]|nr:hypothetical protein [Phycisphaerales bacterium]
MSHATNGLLRRRGNRHAAFTFAEIGALLVSLGLLAGGVLPTLLVAERDGERTRGAPAKQAPTTPPDSADLLQTERGAVVPSAEALLRKGTVRGSSSVGGTTPSVSSASRPDRGSSTAASGDNSDLDASGERVAETAGPEIQAGEPTGDVCSSCIRVDPGSTFIGNNANAAPGAPTSCGGGEDVFDVWHCFVPPCSGTAKINTCGSTFNTTLAAYASCQSPELACNDNGCGAPTAGSSQIEIPVIAGENYFIRIAGVNGARGTYNLRVDLTCCVNCPTFGLPENEPNCGLPQDTINGGCNTPPVVAPQFTPIACNQTRCGTVGHNGTTRDTDWYQVMVPTPAEFTWTVSAEFAAQIGLAETDPPGTGNCIDHTGQVNPFIDLPPCTTGSVTVCLPPGKHWFFVSPVFAAGAVNCGARYTARLDCATCIPTQACCIPTGGCVDTDPVSCDGQFQGSPQGAGTSCETVVCAAPPQACCTPFGQCFDVDPNTCDIEFQGTPQGAGTSCNDNVSCPSSTQACCTPSGQCFDTSPFICDVEFQGTSQGAGTTCDGTSCPGSDRGACCNNEDCFLSSPLNCVKGGGLYFGGGTNCNQVTCPPEGPVGACCRGTDCAVIKQSECELGGGFYSGDGVSCVPDVCVGQCCLRDAFCDRVSIDVCFSELSGIYWVSGGNCEPNDCPKTGGCCLDGGCFETSEGLCVDFYGGQYLGNGVDCSATACFPPNEACCLPRGGCQAVPRQICILELGGEPQGPGSDCATANCNFIEVDDFPDSEAVFDVMFADGAMHTVHAVGPTRLHVFFEGAEGQADDDNGNNLDDVETEMVQLQLTGMTPIGPFVVRLQDPMLHGFRSMGQIEELEDTQTGRLDLPPFAEDGMARSSFDVYTQVDVAGLTFHSHQPKRMSSFIDHKPPGPGTTYFDPVVIELFDANENPTGIKIIRASHTPRPPRPEIDFFPNTTAVMQLQLPDGSGVPIPLMGPTTVDVYFEGAAEGVAFDNDGDDRDEVRTRMTQMDLMGMGPMGPVSVRLNPNMPTEGEIEETADQQ